MRKILTAALLGAASAVGVRSSAVNGRRPEYLSIASIAQALAGDTSSFGSARKTETESDSTAVLCFRHWFKGEYPEAILALLCPFEPNANYLVMGVQRVDRHKGSSAL
jgi:hypothetical protein